MGTVSLVDMYKLLLSQNLARRALGTLSIEDEGALATERVDIWDQLSDDEREKLEVWIDLEVNGRDWSMPVLTASDPVHSAGEQITTEDQVVNLGERLPPRKAAA